MTPYNFEVLKDGVVIDMQSIHLPHIRFAWPEIMRLAKRFHGPGHRIRVKDDAGGIVILTHGRQCRPSPLGERGLRGMLCSARWKPVASRPFARRVRSKQNLAAQKR